jgi:hypothetical protein
VEAAVFADRWKRHRYDLWASRIHLLLLHVLFAVLRYLDLPSLRLVLRHRLFAPLELVHVWAAEAVAPVLPSLLVLGFRPAFFCLSLDWLSDFDVPFRYNRTVPDFADRPPHHHLLRLAKADLLLLVAALAPAEALISVLLPAGALVFFLSVAALLPEDRLVIAPLAATEAVAAALLATGEQQNGTL